LRNSGNIYLIGLSGSGKSTVGPLLAERLRWVFFDTDDLIEATTGMAVTDIFSAFGEPAFRQHETAMIEHVATMFRDVVASLGGGAVVSGKNRTLMHETGTMVYLKASPAVLAERLAEGSARRPLLHGAEGDLVRTLQRLLDRRSPLYEEAHLTINSDGLSAEEITDRIVAAL
jgi:shikimate kinase